MESAVSVSLCWGGTRTYVWNWSGWWKLRSRALVLKQTEEGEQRGLGAAYFKESGRQKWFSFFSYFILFSYFPLEKVYSLIVFFGGGDSFIFWES